MEWIVVLIQIIIALGILNVWILRFGKATAWRGGDAQNMRQESQAQLSELYLEDYRQIFVRDIQ